MGTDLPAPEAAGPDRLREELAALRAENAHLRTTLDAVRLANAELDVDKALEAVLDASQKLFGADRCAVLIGRSGSQHRTVRAFHGLSERYREHLASGFLPLQMLSEEQAPLALADAIDDSPVPLTPEKRELMEAEGIRGIAVLRMQHQGEQLGVLILYFNQRRQLDERELVLAQAFADQAALALLHARDFEFINRLSRDREAEQRWLQQILDTIQDVVIVWRPTMEVVSANANARAFLAATGADLCRERLAELLPPPDECPVRRVLQSRRPVTGVEVLFHGRYYQVDCYPLFDETSSELLAVVQHARDVNENRLLQQALEHSEERFRTGMEAAPVGVAMLCVPSLTIDHANQELCQMSEATVDDLAGSLFEEWFRPDQRPLVRDLLRTVIDETRSTCDETWLLTHAGGTTPVALMLALHQYRDGGRMIQVVVRDIRRRLQLQNQLVEQEKLAAIGHLASGVAHEIRNPLGIIAGALYDLQEIIQTDDPDVIEDLTIARDEIARVQEIINNVLDFARGTSVEREWVDLGDLLSRTLALMRKSMANRDIEVSFDNQQPPPVWANGGALRQVALNLVTNSYQATADGGRITVTVKLAQEGWIEFAISDTGQGIPPEHLHQLFNPFFTTKAPGQGTGLGLSIVYATIREHGGEITVDSEVGAGTTFTVLLPVRASGADASDGSPLSSAADALLR